jgi:hypothetical protein
MIDTDHLEFVGNSMEMAETAIDDKILISRGRAEAILLSSSSPNRSAADARLKEA